MDWSLHHRIARTALKLQILGFDEVSKILRELGGRAAAGEQVSVQLWHQSGWVSQTEFDRLVDAVDAEVFEEMETARHEGVTASAQEPGLEGETEPLEMESREFEGTPTTSHDLAEPSEGAVGIDVADTLRDGDIDVSDTLRDGDFEVAFGQTDLYRSPLDNEADGLLENRQRYQLREELGRGGGGRVVRAEDRQLKRDVAMKIHDVADDSEEAVRRFFSEAQAACQLEHPNIMPVYDAGRLDDGSIYYTMLLIDHDSLADILDGLRKGHDEYVEEYTLSRLLVILKQVSQALDYAHDRGVIHRDIKPSNIMLGEFGEVLVMDWGLAHVSGEGVSTEMSEQGETLADSAHTLGTPAYMSPEQARGRLDEVDERSDVFALGMVLHEILVLEPPYEGMNPVETMRRVVDGHLESPMESADHDRWDVPRALNDICLKALERRQEERFQTAGELFEELQQFLDGIRPRRARQQLAQGREAAERYHDGNARIEQLTDKINGLLDVLEPWEPIDKKRELWRLEDRRQELTLQRARSFGDAVTGFQQALANDPDCTEARDELAQLYWQRYCEAEAVGDEFEQVYFDAMIREVGNNEYLERLSRQVEVRLQTRPSEAEVTLFPYEEIDRRLVISDERYSGSTPVEIPELEVGRYLVVIDAPGKQVVRAPMYARRGEAVDMRVSLPAEQQTESNFAFIPGGPCFVGGDPDAINARARRKIEVSSFFCARFPVTFGEYLEFLDALPRDEARRRAPRRGGGRGLLVTFDESDGRWKPMPYYSDVPDNHRDLTIEQSRWQLPVVGITGDDAATYCQWRSQRDGRSYRLPSEAEWEKAGRGVDGRLFPWGDEFDATFCKMQQSRPHQSQLEPVGNFVDDASPYGVRDLSGGVHEWCQGDDDEMPIRGGAWDQGERACRLASTRRVNAGRCGRNIGMRLVYDVEFGDHWTGTQRVQQLDPDA